MGKELIERCKKLSTAKKRRPNYTKFRSKIKVLRGRLPWDTQKPLRKAKLPTLGILLIDILVICDFICCAVLVESVILETLFFLQVSS